MKNVSLTQQIQREVKAHPVKAGVLALALLVALWFWAPLVIGWVSPQSKTSATPAPAVATSGASAAMGVSTTLVTAKSEWNPHWREMADWIDKDETMRPAESLEKTRDPFRKVTPPPSTVQASQPAAPKIDPESLGLELSSTLIGSRHSVAMINGRAYTLKHQTLGGQRQPVLVSITLQDQQYQFTLMSIAPDHVEFEYSGQPFFLRVKDRPLHERTIELNEKSTIEIHGRVFAP